MTSYRTLFLESVAGVAGDMFTAAFLDAGLVDPELIQRVPELIQLPGVAVDISDTLKAGARFTRVQVTATDGSRLGSMDHHHVGQGASASASDSDSHSREGSSNGHSHDHSHGHSHDHHPYGELVKRLEDSDLEPAARAFALEVFRLLAEAEADSHGVALDQVVFHEVGAVDSVVDVAMAGVCIASVAPERVLASPVKLGRGSVKIQHGTYPVPPPASARLARGMPVASVPDGIEEVDVELSTPTGLAILKALNPTFYTDGWPPGTVEAQGAGAGSMDLGDYPNVFRVALLHQSEAQADSSRNAPSGETHLVDRAGFPPGEGKEGAYDTDTVLEIRCNLDDETGERVSWLMEKALARGALDGWVTQVVGKKGRPAMCLTLLVKPEDGPGACGFLLEHSSTFGVRHAPWGRLKLPREEEVRKTLGGPLRFKIGRTRQGRKVKEKPEYEDLKRIWEEDPDFEP